MNAASWVTVGTTVLAGAVAAVAWRKANRADQARLRAEAERDAALEQVAALTQMVEAARPAIPPHVDFDVLRIRGPIDRFRLRNVGAGTATNVRFVIDPAEEENPRIPTPQWHQDGPVILPPTAWADFSASALSPVAGVWRMVFPAFVTVICDEAGTPRRIDLPTKVVAEGDATG
ncbi:hypothetical protein ACFTWF_19795 [Rhodococcus sp. NPDC056960]|uniref:hypothetical protein n=1 Tax=Rhodococcus sp. NPDC056960 TaxID=3345982 RepID=UPI003643CE15